MVVNNISQKGVLYAFRVMPYVSVLYKSKRFKVPL
jgi:hypothetical protein